VGHNLRPVLLQGFRVRVVGEAVDLIKEVVLVEAEVEEDLAVVEGGRVGGGIGRDIFVIPIRPSVVDPMDQNFTTGILCRWLAPLATRKNQLPMTVCIGEGLGDHARCTCRAVQPRS